MVGIEAKGSAIKVRPAEQNDALDVLRWRNDAHTRAMSRNGDLVEEKSHCTWFEQSLQNRDRLLLIGVLFENKIGMVRFDKQMQAATWEVSIMLAPEQRAKGLGKALLTLALSHFLVLYPNESVLLAEVKQGNAASQRLFVSVGFLQEESEGEMLRFIFQREPRQA